MTRTCQQLGYCLNAERETCLGKCQHPEAVTDSTLSTLERIVSVALWIAIAAITCGVVGVIAGFGWQVLKRIG